MVIGVGKGEHGLFEGDPCEATLLTQIWPGSESWFVHMRGDKDEQGHPIKRIRQFVSLIKA